MTFDNYGSTGPELGAIDTSDLASRGARLGAAILDSLLAMVFVLPAMSAFGFFDGFPDIEPISTPDQLALAAAGFALFLVLHGYLLYTQGQTVGKRLVGIRIVRRDRSRADFGIIVSLRVVPISIAAQIPLVGQLLTVLDVLFIFTKERRCIHDRIADTVVVRVGA